MNFAIITETNKQTLRNCIDINLLAMLTFDNIFILFYTKQVRQHTYIQSFCTAINKGKLTYKEYQHICIKLKIIAIYVCIIICYEQLGGRLALKKESLTLIAV